MLPLLRCPETLQRLRMATEEELARAKSSGGDDAALEAGLIREDGAVLYPCREGIPTLLVEAAIRL